MLIRQIFASAMIGIGITLGLPSSSLGVEQVLSTAPPNVEYQYQMYFPRFWGWPGPGLSLGGSLPSRGREGISSFYGLPVTPPLGAGVYMNPFAYSTRLPGFPPSFGLSSNTPSPNSGPQQSGQPTIQAAGSNQPISFSTRFGVNTTRVETNRQPLSNSDLSSIEQSREIESFGDESVKRQQWTQAYVNYHNAAIIADGRADIHVRLGLVSVMLKRFPEAVGEFKRALAIDPKTGKSGETLQSMLGPDDRAVRAEIVQNVAKWTKEDLRDQDHLFLLGVVLTYNNDRRSSEILEAAMQMKGSKEHLAALLAPSADVIAASESIRQVSDGPTPNPPEQVKLPELHREPLALR